MVDPIQPSGQTLPSVQRNEQALMQVARDLEASFLSEMLKSAGLGKTNSDFSGGAGEEQFSSFLVDEQARAMVEAGGIGLAESIFAALKDQKNDE